LKLTKGVIPMATENLRSVQVVRRFEFSAERVFDAWLDPNTAGQWLFAHESRPMIKVEIDPRVGGSFNITRRDGDDVNDDVEHVGEYLEIDRPRRLVFTFSVPKFAKQITRVTVDIVPVDGGCQLTLTHEDVLPEWASATESGWGNILNSLALTRG
jgi:uncharacterized protein YndB with AHSA1/START domain